MRRTPLTNHVIAIAAKQSIVQHLVRSDLCTFWQRHSMDCRASLAMTGAMVDGLHVQGKVTPRSVIARSEATRQSIVQPSMRRHLCGVRRRHSMDCRASLAMTEGNAQRVSPWQIPPSHKEARKPFPTRRRIDMPEARSFASSALFGPARWPHARPEKIPPRTVLHVLHPVGSPEGQSYIAPRGVTPPPGPARTAIREPDRHRRSADGRSLP